MRRTRVALALGVFVLAVLPGPTLAQPSGGTVRIASLTQWVMNQHRDVPAELRAAVDGGVVDGLVFWWRRGVISRKALVPKPVRVVPGPEVGPLGGRGDFDLAAVRPPAGRSAWAEVDVVARSGRADDVLVLELGGEMNVITQVLETLFVAPAGGGLEPLRLARRSLVPSDGVPVLSAAYGRPVNPGTVAFRGASGLEFLVARSPVEAVVNGGMTVNGPADVSPRRAGEWREGDRVFLRIPLATLRGTSPGVVLGWKDRLEQVDPDGGNSDMRLSGLSVGPLRR